MNHDQISKRVSYILNILNLTGCCDIVISPVSGDKSISGGQKRRVSIALALLQNPSVLILDEPTSGLDAQSSLEVINVLSSLSKQGYTILVTIHQPRTEIFEQFSNLLVMAQGRVVLHDSREQTVKIFDALKSELGLSTSSSNFADDILDIATAMYAQNHPTLTKKQSVLSIDATLHQNPTKSKKEQKASLWTQFTTINSRFWKLRPTFAKFSMLSITILTSLVLGVLQRRTGSDLISLSLQIKGLTIATLGISALKNISISFDYYTDRDFYNFDSLNGLISPFAFFIHRVVYETSMATLESLTCAILTYFLLGCSTNESSLTTVISLMVLYYNTIVSLYTLIYATRLARPEARNISFFAQAILAVTSGIWIKRGDTVAYSFMTWLEYINPNYWVLAPLIRANLVGAGDCLVLVDGCRSKMGDLLVHNARIDEISPSTAVQVLLLMIVVLRTLQYLLLLRDSK